MRRACEQSQFDEAGFGNGKPVGSGSAELPIRGKRHLFTVFFLFAVAIFNRLVIFSIYFF